MAESVTFEMQFRNKRFESAYLGFQYLAKKMDKSLDDFGDVLSIELRRFLKTTMKELAMVHSTPYPGGTTPKSLSRRSGKAFIAIMNSWEVTGNTIPTIEGVISLPKEVAFHEKGGVITAKRAKYLTIPLPAALRSNGTPIKRSAREWKNTFVGTSKKGNLLIFQKTATGIIPLYALKKSVKIPPRLGLVPHVKSRLPHFIDRAFEAMVERLLEKK